MKTVLFFSLLASSSLAAAQLDSGIKGSCSYTKKDELSVSAIQDGFEFRIKKSKCLAKITKARNLDRGPQQKEIFYLDLSRCPRAQFRESGFLKFENYGSSVRGLANVVTEGPLACEFPVSDWKKVRELSGTHQ